MENEIIINGIKYVPEQQTVNTEGKEYVIVRGDRSGVFAGFLESQNGREVILNSCRRIWYWEGAATISQLAIDGVSLPEKCKFPAPVRSIRILDVIEIIPCTIKAKMSIEGVLIWAR